MSILSRLFGGKSKPAEAPKAEEYNGYRIFAEPIKEGSTYRLAARIEKDTPDGVKSHQVIRADTFGDVDEATEISAAKARQVVDQMGDAIFD